MDWEIGGPWILTDSTRRLSSDDVTAVYLRRARQPEAPRTIAHDAVAFVAREAGIALRGFYDALTCPWISSYSALRDAENKPRQLRLARSLGLRVPDTIVTQDASRARDFTLRNGAVVLKPLFHGELGAGRVAHTTRIERWDPAYDVDVETVPHLFQHFVSKVADYRVTIIDERVFPCRIDSGSYPAYAVDVRRGLADFSLRHEMIRLSSTLTSQLINLVKGLGLRFGAIDLIEDSDGELWFLEINPNGQWAWIEQRTGAPISDAIADALIGGAP
jgi:glutathione synthase/RimK-type ligase-like ATP-grasp enzyme